MAIILFKPYKNLTSHLNSFISFLTPIFSFTHSVDDALGPEHRPRGLGRVISLQQQQHHIDAVSDDDDVVIATTGTTTQSGGSSSSRCRRRAAPAPPGRMIDHKPQLLLAPALSNSSCWRSLPGGAYEARWQTPGIGELLRATIILALSLGILGGNLLVICVINSRRYHKYIHAQVS